MGKKPDDIESEIRAKRRAISDRLQSLEARAGDDVSWLRSSLQDRANEVADKAGAMFKVPESMQERPYTTLLGAAGLGVALGMASEGIPAPRRNDSRNGRQNDGEGGLLDGFFGSILGVAAGTIQDEMKRLIREGFSEVRPTAQRN
jgi:ElaB/YqjD/DUF883 family membrane-anchored ribosome-binding protein